MASIWDLLDEEPLLNAIRRREVSSNPHDPDAPLIDHDKMVSSAGATGEMQIIPSQAMDPGYGAENIFDVGRAAGFDVASEDESTARALANDPLVAREYAKSYISAMYDKFGNLDAAIGAYNVGPGAMGRSELKYDNLPKETQDYVANVRRFYGEATGSPYAVGMSTRPRLRPAGLLEQY